MSWMKLTILVIVILVVFGMFAGLVMAQDADTEGKTKITIGDNIMASMPIGGVIIAISIALMGLIIEHFVNIKRDKIIPPEVIQELEVYFEEEDYEGALEFCEATPGFVTNVLATALPRMSQGFEAMKEGAQEIGEEEAVNLQIKISFLSLISTIGPMLGLFGTVTGMVTAFNVIAASAGNASPAKLADGISQALMTTVLGLTVAIPALGFYFFFKNRVIKIILEAGVVVSEFIDRFRPVDE
jgi:biopolymer transport protein ExbB